MSSVRADNETGPLPGAVLYALFFLSGATALVFETLWFRLAGLAFGNSLWASSLVLASFMGGLAIGNGVVGRWGERLRDPLRAYGLLELLIGVLGLGLALLFPLLNALLAPVFRYLTAWPWALNSVRLGLAFLLMLLPAAAMGATLPLLVRELCARQRGFGDSLGLLYGLNTLGAMAGALAGELVLIEQVGVRGTAAVAAILDLSVALVVLRGTRHWGAAGRSADPGPAVAAEPRPLTRRALRLLLAAFLAGGLLLALEVVWFRTLRLHIFGTSVVFAVMLAVVLAGIGIGGFLASRYSRLRRQDRLAAATALLSGAAAVLTLTLYASPALGLDLAWSTVGWVFIGRAVRLMLPVSVLSGVLFTLLGTELHTELGSETRAAGYLTLANTLGAMLGALVAGFLLVPGWGVEASFAVLALGYGGVGLLAFAWPPGGLVRPERIALATTAVAFLLACALFPRGSVSARIFASSYERFTKEGAYLEALREGSNEIIFYLRADRFGRPYYHRLVTNGHSMSDTSTVAQRYMKLFVYLPVALHPRPRRALLICYGVGMTARALANTASLERIDVVDISRDVVELGELVYPSPADHPLRDPRVRVTIEDGRFFLQTTDERYDLITSEPPPPQGLGVVNLYSREYFQLTHDRLAPGGMATHWLPVPQLNEADLRAIVRAWVDVFPESSLWVGSGGNWILLGVREGGRPVSEEEFRRPWQDPRMGAELRDLGVESPEQLGALFVLDGEGMLELVGDIPPLVDDFPYRLSPWGASEWERLYPLLLDPGRAQHRFLASGHIRRLWPEGLRRASLRHFAARFAFHDSMTSWKFGPKRDLIVELSELLSMTDYRTLVLWRLGTNADELRLLEAELRDHPGPGHPDPAVHRLLGHRALADRDYAAAATHYAAANERKEGDAATLRLLVLALFLDGRPDEARRVRAGGPPDLFTPEALRLLRERFALTVPRGS
ncbi:MAG: spermidine synthase [Candidatus Methylomirabilales bacterium]